MIVKKRLAELIKQLNLKQTGFAQEIGVSQPTISDWINKPNVNPSIESLIKISNAFNVNLNWLLTGNGPMFNNVPARASESKPRELAGNELVPIPVSADIAAGKGIEAFDVEPEEHLLLHRSLLNVPGPYYAFKVEGGSMQPFIQPGDYAVVTGDWHDRDIQNRVCAIRTIDGLMLKRFYAERRRALLIPLNPNYPVIRYTPDDPEFVIVGLLVLLVRKYI